MSATSLKLDILTPMGAVRDGVDVPGVEVPGVLGELGVLPQHESLLTAISPGIVRFREGAKTTRLAVGSGFLEVKEAGRVIILCDRAIGPDEVDKAAVTKRLAEVKAQIEREKNRTVDELRPLEDERRWLEAQLRLVAA
jgi:F-type H+-transporting ATPase subunit epsilon